MPNARSKIPLTTDQGNYSETLIANGHAYHIRACCYYNICETSTRTYINRLKAYPRTYIQGTELTGTCLNEDNFAWQQSFRKGRRNREKTNNRDFETYF